MIYYVVMYPYPYQTSNNEYRNSYPVNMYYAYPYYYDNHNYALPTYPINEVDSYLEASYPSDRQGTISLQNAANTQWKDHYLDIDGNTGQVILWPHLGSGGYWKLTNHGNGTVSLQNAANTQWKDHYLDIDGNTGQVILWPHLGSGGYWGLTDHNGPDGPPPPPPDELEPGVHRNLIRRISYDEPYSKTCYKNVAGVKVPYPCFGMKTKVIEIYLETRYPPEATLEQKAAIIACAGTATSVSYSSFLAAYGATTAATAGIGGIIAGVAAGILAAETAGRVSFDECKRKSLPDDIARKTGMSIVQKKFDR